MHVTREQAHKLRDIGFNLPTQAYWYDGDTGNNVDHFIEEYAVTNHNVEDMCVSCPELHTAAKFLRERYGLHVCPMPICNKEGIVYTAGVKFIENEQFFSVMINDSEFNVLNQMGIYTPIIYPTHDTAYSAAITAALDIVEQRNNKEGV